MLSVINSIKAIFDEIMTIVRFLLVVPMLIFEYKYVKFMCYQNYIL